MRFLPPIPAFPGKKPDNPKWPTARFAETDSDAADVIAKRRKRKKREA